MESEVFEAEEQEASLLDKITKIKFFLWPRHPPANVLPEVQSSSTPRSKVKLETDSKPPSKSAAGTDSSHVNNSSKQQNLIVQQIDKSDQSISLEALNHATQPIPDPISTHVPVSANSTITSSATAQPHPSYNVSRLPKLNMPFYAGDPLLWQSFWDCFDAAVNSYSSLTGVQKLTYLRAVARRCSWSYSWFSPNWCQLWSLDSSSTESLWPTPQVSQCSYVGFSRLTQSSSYSYKPPTISWFSRESHKKSTLTG